MGEVGPVCRPRGITSDNPGPRIRARFIDESSAGAHPKYTIEQDRATAILQAIGGARRRDVVLLAGQSHETYQEIGAGGCLSTMPRSRAKSCSVLPRRPGPA